MAEIKIPIDGVDISVPAWSTEETLQKIATILSKNGSTGSSKLDKTITKIAGTGPGDKKSLAGAIGGIALASDQLGKSGKVADVAFTAASTAITSVSGVVSTLATSKGNFTDLNPMIDAAADAFGGLVGSIPIIGGLLKGLGKGAAEIAKLNNAIADELVGGIDQLTVQGFSLARDFNKVGADATTAGIGFITFADIASKNAQALAALGGTFDKGAKRFLNITELLAKEDEPLAMGMRAFGFSAEATAEFLADFIDSQVGANLQRTMSDQQVAKAAFEVAKQQRIVAELTGTQADDLKRQQEAVREEQSFQAMLQKMRNNGQTNQAKAIEQFVGSLPTKEAQMLAMQMLRTQGAAASQERAMLDLATDGKLGNSIMSGFDSIFAAGEEGALSSVALATSGTVEAIASVANNSAMLETASLGLLGSGNAFSESIGNILQSSRRYKDIIDQNGGDARALAEQLLADTENIAEGNREGISQGNADILAAQKGLEQATINMENVVMQNLGKALMAQVFVINKAIGMINKVLRKLGGDGYVREEKTFEDITSGGGSVAGDFETVITGRKRTAGGSFMGSGEAQMKNYSDQIKTLIDEVGARNVEAAAIGGASAEHLREMNENFKMFDREYNNDGTVKTGNEPDLDIPVITNLLTDINKNIQKGNTQVHGGLLETKK